MNALLGYATAPVIALSACHSGKALRCSALLAFILRAGLTLRFQRDFKQVNFVLFVVCGEPRCVLKFNRV